MKHFIVVVAFIAVIVSNAVAHDQFLHQHFVREGYQVLVSRLGPIPILGDHIGTTEIAGPFTTGTVVSGAYREDEEDIVWGYSATNTPILTGFVAGFLMNTLGVGEYLGQDPFVSTTHFWDADNPDDLKSDLEGTWANNHFKMTVPNAYQKIILFRDGNYFINVDLFNYDHPPVIVWTENHTDGSDPTITYTIDHYREYEGGFAYQSLIGFYKTGTIYGLKNRREWETKITYQNGVEISRLDYGYNVNLEYPGLSYDLPPDIRNKFVFDILGRMCHLLGDVGVPAHAHRDIHGNPDDGIREEDFEIFMKVPENFNFWNASNVSSVLDPFVSSNPLHYLMFTTQQNSDHFGSSGPYEGDGDDNYVFPHTLPEERAFLDARNLGGMGGPTGANPTPSWAELINIRDHTIPQVISATAGLLYWFAVEADLVSRVQVKNSFGGGSLKVNGNITASGTTLDSQLGTGLLLEAATQYYAGNWWRPISWKKSVDNGSPETHVGSNWTTIVDDGYLAYEAVYQRQFTVSLQNAQTISGSGSGRYFVDGVEVPDLYSVPRLEGEVLSLYFEPPPGSIFVSWTDGNINNPRSVTVAADLSLGAIHMVPLSTTSPSLLTDNGGHKLVRVSDPMGDYFYFVYESNGWILNTRSPNSAMSWGPEQLVAGVRAPTQYSQSPIALLDSTGGSVSNIYEKVTLNATTGLWDHTITWDGGPYVPVPGTYARREILGGFSTGDPNFRSGVLADMSAHASSRNSLLSCVWKNGSGLSFGLGGYPYQEGFPGIDPSYWSVINLTSIFPSTTGVNDIAFDSRTRPGPGGTTSTFASAHDYYFYLVWDQSGGGGGIKAVYGTLDSPVWPPAASAINWVSSPVVIAANSGTSIYSNPTLTLDQSGNVIIGYQLQNGSVSEIRVQRRGAELTSLDPSPGYSVIASSVPNISGLRDPNIVNNENVPGKENDLDLVWTTAEFTHFYSHFNGTSSQWSQLFLMPTGGQTAILSESRSSIGSNKRFASVGQLGPVYSISISPLPNFITMNLPTGMGWSMLSVPVGVHEIPKTTIFPDASSPAWGFQNGYVESPNLNNGPGYWLKFPTITPGRSVSGAEITSLTTALNPGWNIIGSTSESLPIGNLTTNPPGLLSPTIYSYRGGYDLAGAIEPGNGYWAYSSGSGQLNYNPTSSNGLNTNSFQPPTDPYAHPLLPTLLSPSNGATNRPTTLTLSWNASNGATRYWLQLSASPDFSSRIVDDGTLTTTSRLVGPLTPGTTYYWRVSAANSEGTSAWSNVWSFNVPNLPGGLSLVSPPNGATNQSVGPTLNWNAAANAFSYQLQVALNPDFSTPDWNDSMITTLNRQVTSLLNSSTYYWRVRARNATGVGSWSSVWSFVTSFPPPAPNLNTPANTAQSQPLTLTLSWFASTGAVNYTLQTATNSGFTSPTVYSNLTTTSKQIGPLIYSTTYYWRVSASNVIGSSAWSAVRSFTTTTAPPPIPGTPTLDSPISGSIDQLTSPTLHWNASSNAASYQVQVSLNPGFSSIVADHSTTALFRTVSLVEENTLFYWRVRASNVSGTSSWSSVWSFRTLISGGPGECDQFSSSMTMAPDEFILSDAHGNRQKLYVHNQGHQLGEGHNGPQMDEMPPEPPEGVADIRFESGKIMEKVPPGHQLTVIPIKLRDIAYPITVRWNVHAENALIYNLVLAGHGRSGEAEGGHVGLSDSGSIVLEKKGHGNDNGNGNGNGNGDGGGGVIILQAEAPDPCDPPQAKTRIKADAEAVEENLPSVYALRQNFPNPFNPTTEIYYDLPESGPVSIVLYNILGQSVLTLVDEVQSAGYKSFNLNMSLFPSGVYYYRMQAGGFNDLKKMVLIK